MLKLQSLPQLTELTKLKPKLDRRTILGMTLVLSLLGGFCVLTPLIHHYSVKQELKLRQESSRLSSALIALRDRSPQARASMLRTLSDAKKPTLDRHRARYLLAIDLLKQEEGEIALSYLEDLEEDYPVLAPYILLHRAEAYLQIDRLKQAQQTYQQLRTLYPTSPAVADGLNLFGEIDSQQQQQLLAHFPYHPQTQAIARQLLVKNPDSFDLLLLLAKYSRDTHLDLIRDRLVLQYPAKLTAPDWQAIADGYWREGDNRKAADAYSLATSTPNNLYRAAKGYHLNGNIDDSRRAYQKLIAEYHDAREVGEALLYLARISSGDEAMVYLDRAIALFPDSAPQALLSKAAIYDAFAKPDAANRSREEVLQKYPTAPVTINYRWKIAQKLASQGDRFGAWQLMQPLVNANVNIEIAPKALFWTGKWAMELNNQQAAHRAWQKVIELYPQSYYAWRSAVSLGWNVGNFTSLRSLNRPLKFVESYAPLPLTSETLQELYLLGQYQDAWTLLQSEIERPQQPKVQEQFAEGLLLLKLGNTSLGMLHIFDLAQREDPLEIKTWQFLRQTDAYWYGLFPFPYREEILQAASQNKIDPLLVISVIRQESSFAPQIDSRVGAVGLMQIVPPTAKWVAQQISLSPYSLTNPQDNIKIGSWYLAHNHDRYQNNSLLAAASYNAGTGNVHQWLNRYSTQDWDRFVESIPFVETHDYVEGVLGNYWNYLRLYNPEMKLKIQQQLKSQPLK
jgi:soluble lytic murein transglycosylase